LLILLMLIVAIFMRQDPVQVAAAAANRTRA
jgi:hypothetical protein